MTQDIVRTLAEMGWRIVVLSAQQMKDGLGQKVVMRMASSMFFVYSYHAQQDLGFVILTTFQTWLVGIGVMILVAWIFTALVIFVIGLALDSVRRVIYAGAGLTYERLFGRCA